MRVTSFESLADRGEELVADDVTVGVVHSLEVVEVQQQDRPVAPASQHLGVCVGEAVLEERPVRQSGQGVVQRLVRQLGGQGALFGDVAFGEHEVHGFPSASKAGERDTSTTITWPSLRR